MTQLLDALPQAGWTFKLTYGFYGLGYASLTMAMGLGILGLLKPGDRRLEPASSGSRATNAPDANEGGPPAPFGRSASPLVLPHVVSGLSPAITSELNFEKLNRTWIRFGFLMLAGGLVSHGTWDWNPWEYVSLLSGLSYGAVLHMHYVPVLKGRKALWASLGAWVFTLLVLLLAID